MSDNRADTEPPWRARLAKYREKLFEAALLGVPLALVQGCNERLGSEIASQPWQATVVLLPMAVIVVLLLRVLARRGQFVLDGRFLAFLGAYVLLFSLAAQTKLLDWERDPALFGEASGGSWLTPVGWGDWRYRLVPKVDGDELVIVLREPTVGKTREMARLELVNLLGIAANHDAAAVVLDYQFDGESQVDSLLCEVMRTVRGGVIAGYGFERFQGRLNPLPVPRSLQACITPANHGHLVGFLDADLTARLMPLFFNDRPDRPALSLMIARLLVPGAELTLPSNGRLRFVEPARPHIVLRVADISNPSARNAMANRVVIIGEESEQDSFDTPFGRKPGAVVHADAAHSLVHGHYIRDMPWWFTLVTILAPCHLIAAWCAAGASLGRLFALAGASVVAIVAMAVVAILIGPYWLEVAYPAAAVLGLPPLLVGVRRVVTNRQPIGLPDAQAAR